jgi:hypothetical protein
MPLACVLARSAQRHALIDRHVVSDFSRLPDDDSHAVVDETSLSDHGTGVNFYACKKPRKLREHSGKQLALMIVQPMRGSVQHLCPNARIAEQDLQTVSGRRIPRHGRSNIICGIFEKRHTLSLPSQNITAQVLGLGGNQNDAYLLIRLYNILPFISKQSRLEDKFEAGLIAHISC